MLNRYMIRSVLLAFLLTGIGSQAYGVSLMAQEGVRSIIGDGIVYEITDRHQGTDQWDGSAGGYSGTGFAGYYLGTVTNQNNDSLADIENLIRAYLDDQSYTTQAYLKSDEDPADLGITYAASSDLAGSWSMESPDISGLVSFYAVKGAKEYALYYMDQPMLSGDWTTAHLLTPNGKNQPGLSHLSVSVTSESEPVPEPATLWLLVLGLAILIALTSKRMTFKGLDCAIGL